ncbi:MAG: sigma-70 family RNA polymerase sigma factor [Archangiaceae bacterium]|nr:sigma-70 family RNA polymerase sigma factor [Archangiaceae bacterium]
MELQRSSVGPVPDFRALYTSKAPLVWRTLKRLGVREADLEDVAQEVFVVVHRRLPEFEGRSSIDTWLYGICLRIASDFRKKAHVKRETDLAEAPERSHSGETATRQIAMRQARLKLDEALNELDEDKRAVFVLFELEQLSMQEVAETVGAPVQTAYARLYAARKHIEAFVNQQRQVSA